MNWNNQNEEEYEEDEEDCKLIDPNDINMIEEANWRPQPQYINAYAKQLGYDQDKDPKELLTIAEKYLTTKLPNNIKRAFMKETLQILYIDMNTQEIQLETEIEEKAKEEFENYRKMKQSVLEAPPAVDNNDIKKLNNKKEKDNDIFDDFILDNNNEDIDINNEVEIKKKNGLDNLKNNKKNNKMEYDDLVDLDDEDSKHNNNKDKNLVLDLNINDNEEDIQGEDINNSENNKKELILNLNDSNESKESDKKEKNKKCAKNSKNNKNNIKNENSKKKRDYLNQTKKNINN